MGESTTSTRYPLDNPDPSLTCAQQTRYMEGPRPPCGFWYPTVDQILVSWLAYTRGEIQYQDLRGYWYLHEMRMKRCDIPPGTRVHYPLFNLAQGIETGPRQAAQVREHLRAAGLALWTDHDIQMPTQLNTLPWLDRHAYDTMRAKVDTKLSRVPLHRTIGRYLAREGSPGLLATTLGVALRCLRYHGKTKQCSYAGAVSSGWQASLWDFSERTAYRGLDTLEALCFLKTERRPPWHEEAFGTWRVVSRVWEPPQQRLRRPQQLSLPLPTDTRALARAEASSPPVPAWPGGGESQKEASPPLPEPLQLRSGAAALGDDPTAEALVAIAPDPTEPLEDGCKKLSPRSCTDLAVSENPNH